MQESEEMDIGKGKSWRVSARVCGFGGRRVLRGQKDYVLAA